MIFTNDQNDFQFEFNNCLYVAVRKEANIKIEVVFSHIDAKNREGFWFYDSNIFFSRLLNNIDAVHINCKNIDYLIPKKNYVGFSKAKKTIYVLETNKITPVVIDDFISIEELKNDPERFIQNVKNANVIIPTEPFPKLKDIPTIPTTEDNSDETNSFLYGSI